MANQTSGRDLSPEEKRRRFLEDIQSVLDMVAKWPEWKRNALGPVPCAPDFPPVKQKESKMAEETVVQPRLKIGRGMKELLIEESSGGLMRGITDKEGKEWRFNFVYDVVEDAEAVYAEVVPTGKFLASLKHPFRYMSPMIVGLNETNRKRGMRMIAREVLEYAMGEQE